MRRSLIFLLFAMIAVVISACSNTVTYDKANNLKLNYIVPSGLHPSNGYPAIVFFHGARLGNIDYLWSSRDSMMNMAQTAANNGYFAISVDWRQPEDTSVMWPDQLANVIYALAWLTNDLTYASNWSKPNPYWIDVNRIGVVGLSFGGTLALMMGHHDQVKAVVSLAGPTNLETLYRYEVFGEKEDERDLDPSLLYSKSISDFLESLLGPYLKTDVDGDGIPDYDPKYFTNSPIQNPATRVPMLLLHGSLDNFVPLSQSRIMMTKIRSLGGVCDLIVYKAGHGSVPGLATASELAEPMDINSGVSYSQGETGMKAILEFFDAML